ncbi:MAG: DUF5665 domain-containing protein [Paracoccaceae bacterium]
MPPDTPGQRPQAESDAVLAELASLRVELARLNAHRYIKVHNSYWQMIGFQFLRGLATGLGTVIGATVVVSFLALSLAKIDFIPIVGKWAARIAEQIQIHN